MHMQECKSFGGGDNDDRQTSRRVRKVFITYLLKTSRTFVALANLMPKAFSNS